MARMGMDADAVEQTGRELKRSGESVASLVGAIDKTVKGLASVWDGPDARRFVSEWWPQHKAALLAVGESVSGLGQSALNNVSEQREVSGEGGVRDAGGGAGGGGSVADHPRDDHPAAGSTSGALPPSDRACYDQWLHNGQPKTKVADNCTSWVEFRRQTMDPPMSVPPGHGGAMAGNAGGTTSTPPTLGAIVSFGAGTDADPGHVMIIEEVRPDGSFRVSEMNTNRPYAEDGDYDPDLGYVRQDRVWRPNGDGTYTPDHGTDLASRPYHLTIAP